MDDKGYFQSSEGLPWKRNSLNLKLWSLAGEEHGQNYQANRVWGIIRKQFLGIKAVLGRDDSEYL